MGILGNLTGWHFLILLVVVLLVFGATRLPALARSLGQSTKILREELKDGSKGDGAAASDASPAGSAKTEAKTEATASSSGADKTS